MNQEDKEIRDLLSSFTPRQHPELDFMARLQSRMDTVDLVKEQLATERRRNRRSIIIAALSGCFIGIFAALALLLLLIAVKPLILFAVIAAITIGVTLGTYYLCRILMPAKKLIGIRDLG